GTGARVPGVRGVRGRRGRSLPHPIAAGFVSRRHAVHPGSELLARARADAAADRAAGPYRTAPGPGDRHRDSHARRRCDRRGREVTMTARIAYGAASAAARLRTKRSSSGTGSLFAPAAASTMRTAAL